MAVPEIPCQTISRVKNPPSHPMFHRFQVFSLLLGLGLVASPIQAQESAFASHQLPGLNETHHYLPTAPQASRFELSLSAKQVRLFQGNNLIQQYPVAVGRPGWETPVGQFEVQTKIIAPAWRHPFEGYVIPSGDPKNPLGQRWIGFWTDGDNWVGFHGTSDSLRPSIGTAASHGCVRMLDEDIQAMYDLIAVGTPVVVTP